MTNTTTEATATAEPTTTDEIEASVPLWNSAEPDEILYPSWMERDPMTGEVP